jgi:hypothetical protein
VRERRHELSFQFHRQPANPACGAGLPGREHKKKPLSESGAFLRKLFGTAALLIVTRPWVVDARRGVVNNRAKIAPISPTLATLRFHGVSRRLPARATNDLAFLQSR